MKNDSKRVSLAGFSTGVPGLDAVLGGDLPEYSFILIAGPPGSGKTTLAQQISFANASIERPALYFTVLGETPLKMLRYAQQLGFFDPDKVGNAVRFNNLTETSSALDLAEVLVRINTEVRKTSPAIVVVDSFRALSRAAGGAPRTSTMDLAEFVHRLALLLASWQATTFLVGEYHEAETCESPVGTLADGIISLSQPIDRNSAVRKLQVSKLRGRAPIPGLHTMRLSREGVQVFPRLVRPRVGASAKEAPRWPPRRLEVGVTGLDEMLGGGIFVGDSVLVAGPAGSGKTMLSTQFVAAGAAIGEASVIAVFEEHPAEYLARAKSLGFDLERMVTEGKLRIIYLRPLDLSVDETLQEVQEAVAAIGAKRVVIDSLSGFELALAPTFRDDFRESLYRMVGSLTGTGVTVWMTVEIIETFGELRFSPHVISFLTDVIILQRYVEIEGHLRRFITVVKMRYGAHSDALRGYEITSDGLVVGEPLERFRGLFTGVARRRPLARRAPEGLVPDEARALELLRCERGATLEQAEKKLGMSRESTARALDRLVALNYATAAREKQKTVYRASERAGR